MTINPNGTFRSAGRPLFDRRVMGFSAAAVLLLATAGCLDPFRMRLPTVAAGDVRGERLRYELDHDPFPARDIGPETFTRPREFTNNRTDERRALQRQLMRGQAQPGIPPQYAPGPVTPTVPYDPRNGAVVP